MTEFSREANKPTRLDHIGLNATNFFLAELTGVILPFLSAFLKQKHWDYSTIGLTVAMSGLGTLIFQIPAGILSDKIWNRRLLLGGTALLLGVCYAILPNVIDHVFFVDALLFVSGMAGAFFVPLLAALALSLVGHKDFDKTLGVNQSFDHAGNIAASLATLVCVKFFGITAVFYVVGVLSTMVCVSLRTMNAKHLNPDLSKEHDAASGSSRAKVVHRHPKGLIGALREQFNNPSVLILMISVMFFHLANAPTMSTVALYLKHMGAKDDFVAWAIIISQISMVPAAYFASRFCGSRGRKPVMALAFIALAIRISLYPLASNPDMILVIQLANGIDAGIYGVAICLICGDLTKGKEGFNTLLSIMQIAIAFGGVFGPVMQGFITQNLGFTFTFFTFSAIALVGGILFMLKMPETKTEEVKP